MLTSGFAVWVSVALVDFTKLLHKAHHIIIIKYCYNYITENKCRQCLSVGGLAGFECCDVILDAAFASIDFFAGGDGLDGENDYFNILPEAVVGDVF